MTTPCQHPGCDRPGVACTLSYPRDRVVLRAIFCPEHVAWYGYEVRADAGEIDEDDRDDNLWDNVP